MEFISARELRLRPGKVWEKLQKAKELVITSNGKPIGLLSDLPEGDVEAALLILRSLRAEASVSLMRRKAKARGLDRLSPKEIEKEITAVRRQRAA